MENTTWPQHNNHKKDKKKEKKKKNTELQRATLF